MPTVLRTDGLSAVIYFNDHRPAHVHVKGTEHEPLLSRLPDGPASLRENYGFSSADLSRIDSALTAHLAELCARWKEMHDYY